MFSMHGYVKCFIVLSVCIRTGLCWFTFGPEPGPDDSDFTDCGGHITDTSGNIMSPNFADGETYPENANCTWIITVEEGRAIHLVFHFMEIEDHSACYYDQLRVVDAGYFDDVFCGTDLPSDVMSNSNRLILIFTSDTSGNKLGFNITYKSVERTGQQLCARFKDYPIGTFGTTDDEVTNCTWEIQGQTGDRVQLQFMWLHIPLDDDCSQEYVEVVENGDAINKFCGTVPPPLYTSVSKSVSVNFVTQEPSTGKGFAAIFILTDTNLTCGGILLEPAGTIQSPDSDGDGEYDSYAMCFWAIIAPVDKYVKIKFTSVDIEYSNTCDYDRVQLRSGDKFGWKLSKHIDARSQLITEHVATYPNGRYVWKKVFNGSLDTLLDKICGTRAPVLVSTNIMVVSFSSDGTVNKKGFSADYKHITADEIQSPTSEVPPVDERTSHLIGETTAAPPHVNCDMNLTDATGEVMTPGFSSGSNYPNDIDCKWYIIAEEGKTIILTFTAMDIEASPGVTLDCYFDSLEVKEPSGDFHGLFCGTTIPNQIASISNVLILYFASNSEFNHKGFHATYTSFDDGGLPVCQLLGNINAVGKFGSYDLGTAASNGRGCSWIITAPTPDQVVQLYFTRLRIIASETGDVDFNCELNYIEVVDNDESIGIFCGNNLPDLITSTSDKLIVNTVIQNTATVMDFEAHFSVIDKDLKCGEIITARSGRITQGHYENDMSCYWSIIALDKRSIRLDFYSVVIETTMIDQYWTVCVDYVAVYDGIISSSTKLGEVCSLEYLAEYPSFKSETNVLYLHFFSDSQRTFRGFVADYSVHMTESTTPPSTPPVTPTLPWTSSTATTPLVIEDVTSEPTTVSDKQASTVVVDDFSTVSGDINTTTEHEDMTKSTPVGTDVTVATVSRSEETITEVMNESTEVFTGFTGMADITTLFVSANGTTGNSSEMLTGFTDMTDVTETGFTLGVTDVMNGGTETATYLDNITFFTEITTGYTNETEFYDNYTMPFSFGNMTDYTKMTTGTAETGVTINDEIVTSSQVPTALTSAVSSITTTQPDNSSIKTTDIKDSTARHTVSTTAFSPGHSTQQMTELTSTNTVSQPGTQMTELGSTETSSVPETKTETNSGQARTDTVMYTTEPSKANKDQTLSFLSLIMFFISTIVLLVYRQN